MSLAHEKNFLMMQRLLTLCLILLLPLPALAERKPLDIDLSIQSFTLDNGLRVYVNEDHSTPTFRLRLIYDVGARDEEPGHTGFAHLFEHMMFKGSANVPDGGHFAQVEGVGGYSNASTSWDRTDYYEQMPSNYLETALWLESDRLRSLEVTEENFVNQRDAVKEEMARYYNSPYSAILRDYFNRAFEGTPYGHSVFGSIEDLDNSGVSYAQKFFKRYYSPSNAVLALSGDIDFDQVKQLVTKYFGDLPAGKRNPPMAPIERERPSFYEKTNDPLAPLPMLLVGWQFPHNGHEDVYALDLLLTALIDGDSARLPHRLKDELGIALSVEHYALWMRSISTAALLLNPAEGIDFAALRNALETELDKVRKNGISSEELEKARNQVLVATIKSLSTNEGRASVISNGAMYFDDPKRVLYDLKAYDQVTHEDIIRVAKKWLDDRQMVLEVTPGGERKASVQVGNGAKSKTDKSKAKREYPQPPTPSKPRPVNFPDLENFTLDNGLQVYVVPQNDVPLISTALIVQGGSIYARHLPGMTTDMLLEGTTERGKAEQFERVERLGGTLEGVTGLHSAALTLEVLSRDLPEGLEILTETLNKPAFPKDSLERIKNLSRAGLKAAKADANSLASTLYGTLVYPQGHPYGLPFSTEEEIDRIDVAAIRDFYKRTWRPDNGYLVFAGDIDTPRARELAQKYFGDWKAPAGKPVKDPLIDLKPRPAPKTLEFHVVDRPAASQAKILLGSIAIPRNHPDWIPLTLASRILGGGSTGRLFADLREVRGLAYAIGSQLQARRAEGSFQVTTGTRPENTGEMLSGIFGHIDDISDKGPSQTEFKNRVKQIVGRFPLQLETAAQIAYRVNVMKSYDLPEDYFSTYRDKVINTELESVRKAAQRYIGRTPTVVIVGPAERILPELAKTFPKTKVTLYDTNLQASTGKKLETAANGK